MNERADQIRERLEYLRGEIRAERISQGEVAELQGLADYIEDGDTELLEWAGVPEFPELGSRTRIVMDWRGTRVFIPTRYGTVVCVWTEANHVHVAASTGDQGTQILYRDRDWNVSVHLYADLGWTEKPGDDDKYKFTAWYREKHVTISPTWRAAIVAEIESAVAAFVAAHPEIPAEAEVKNLAAELAKAQREENEARTAYLAAHERGNEINGDLRRARTKLAETEAGWWQGI